MRIFIRMKTILYVEDDGIDRDEIVPELEDEGYLVLEHRNGEEAKEHIERGLFDLAIIDRTLPGISGDQLVGAIKRRYPEKPVIAVCATNMGSAKYADITMCKLDFREGTLVREIRSILK